MRYGFKKQSRSCSIRTRPSSRFLKWSDTLPSELSGERSQKYTEPRHFNFHKAPRFQIRSKTNCSSENRQNALKAGLPHRRQSSWSGRLSPTLLTSKHKRGKHPACGSFPSFSKWWSSALAPAPGKCVLIFRFLKNEIFISILQKHGRKFAQAGITIGLQENGTV